MLEGAEIFFRCNPGFVPAGDMTAVCGTDGRWNPDPATLVCTCKIIKASVILHLHNINFYLLTHIQSCFKLIVHTCRVGLGNHFVCPSVCQQKITQTGDFVSLQLRHRTVNLSTCIPKSD